MQFLILVPFVIQALVIGFDEYYFHIKRGLPLWERIGHPLDTLTLLGCLAFTLIYPFSPFHLKWYIGLSIFSCLMVTKDEWIHKHHCPASENWLHALLFLNHPLVLTSVGLLWWAKTATHLPSWIKGWLIPSEKLTFFLLLQTLAVTLFFLYQVIYWNILWKKEKASP